MVLSVTFLQIEDALLCFKKLYPYVTNADHMFDDFLFNSNRKDRKGIMTNAIFGQFNKKFNSNLTYFGEKDRHEYPKYMVNNNDVFLERLGF